MSNTDPKTTATDPVIPAVVASTGSRFETILTAFATKIGKPFAEVRDAVLKGAVNDTSDASLAILGSADDMDDAAWKEMFSDVKGPVLKGAVRTLRETINPVAAPAPAAAPAPVFPGIATAGMPAGMNPLAQLEPVGDDSSFLSLLVTGGSLAEGISTADAATVARVTMANAIGLFTAPAALADRIEAQAEAARAPVNVAAAFKLINSITAREYADILQALGAPVRAVGTKHREKFLARVVSTFLPGLRQFHASLAAWFETYRLERNDPSLLIGALTGGLGGVMPIVTDVSPLRSAAAAFTDACNQTFAGLYAVPASRAMAADTISILQQLNDPAYMVAAGFTTREEMFRFLKVDVTEQFARNEKALETYIVNVLRIPSRDDATLPMFAQNLYLIGQGLDWVSLGGAMAEPTGRKGSNGRTQVVSPQQFSPFPPGNR